MKQGIIEAKNADLDIINWLLTKEGNPNAEINFKRVVEILSEYREHFKIIDNIRLDAKIMELHNENLKEQNEREFYRKQQLENWIESAKKQIQIFKEKNMDSSALCSDAMRIAYKNARELLDEKKCRYCNVFTLQHENECYKNPINK